MIKKICACLLMVAILFTSVNLAYASEEIVDGSGSESSFTTESGTSAVATKKKTKKTIKVLFIGSSFFVRRSGDNHSLEYFEKMAKKGGQKVSITKCIGSGASFSTWGNPRSALGKKARRLIRKKKWDYVVLQVSCYRAYREYGSQKKGLKKLAKYAHKINKKTTVVYDVTWAHQYGSTFNGKRFSSSKKYRMLNEIYNSAYKQTKSYSERCYSGKAINECRKHRNLFIGDREHPNRYGAMLHAACLYATIFKSSPVESSYTAGLNKKTVKHMKKVAAKYCLNKK